VFGVIFPLTEGPPTPDQPSRQNLVVVREDVNGAPLWRHERAAGPWAEFLGVAGPRVLFWSRGRFGALDFNTGATVWTRETTFTSDEMALSSALNLGIIRTKPNFTADSGQLIAVEILEGRQVFEFPPEPSPLYFPRTEPVIAADGTIGVLMQRNSAPNLPQRLEWTELDQTGQVASATPVPYVFPEEFGMTRHEDRDDPYPTVADDGVTYVGYGDGFWAIDPRGGGIRWSLTSTLSEDAFTGTVPLLRDDGVLLINEASRRVIGVKTNGGRMSDDGWASFRHDGRRTNYTPPAAQRP
jgi:outer membrane protein assembly factor BamB